MLCHGSQSWNSFSKSDRETFVKSFGIREDAKVEQAEEEN